MNQAGRAAKLVLASHNPGKVREILQFLAPHEVRVVSAASLGLPEPEENGATFADNAALKALAVARAARLPALADDSGLVVTALGGRPGVHTARWGGPRKDFAIGMARVERELAGAADRSAAFVCTLCLAWPDGRHEIFDGRVDGTLVWPPRGEEGFGYDPMFVPTGYSVTFGEMDPAIKHTISHRARAFAKLAARGLGDLL